MRIDFNQGAQPAPEASQSGEQAGATASAQTASPTAGLGEDQAQLSGAHAQVVALATQAAQLPEIRQEKVQTLRQAISAGRYQANPEKVAGALFAALVAGPAA